jgi:predicted AlkP superfamily phosphohydrolase/phosphomutase
MQSVIPTVSSVAWSTFMSGRNPGEHNIFGFIDRTLPELSLVLPNAANRKGPTLWGMLSRHQVPVIVMNVPVTYPPEQVNGILVGGFLGVDVAKIASPVTISGDLVRKQYIIDADTSSASVRPADFVSHLVTIINRRCDIFCEFCRTYPWHYAHVHIMETDRLFHFLWPSAVDTQDALYPAISVLYDTLDRRISDLVERTGDNTEVLILSDHGFCASHIEWDLNAWLVENGFLKWNSDSGDGLRGMKPESVAYSLLPGRVYLNLNGRESGGSVDSSDAEGIRDHLIDRLSVARQADGTSPVFAEVLSGDGLFSGSCFRQAPDIVAVPVHGVELKSRMRPGDVIRPASLPGMHTRDNAMVWFRKGVLQESNPEIIDLYATILSYFDVYDMSAEGHGIATWPHGT